MSIKVTAITMGHANPSLVGRGGGYLYRGDPKRSPDHPDYVPESSRTSGPPVDAAEARRQQRKERMTAFAAHLAELTPTLGRSRAVIEAGRRVGVGASTAREYDHELRNPQQGRRQR